MKLFATLVLLAITSIPGISQNCSSAINDGGRVIKDVPALEQLARTVESSSSVIIKVFTVGEYVKDPEDLIRMALAPCSEWRSDGDIGLKPHYVLFAFANGGKGKRKLVVAIGGGFLNIRHSWTQTANEKLRDYLANNNADAGFKAMFEEIQSLETPVHAAPPLQDDTKPQPVDFPWKYLGIFFAFGMVGLIGLTAAKKYGKHRELKQQKEALITKITEGRDKLNSLIVNQKDKISDTAKSLVSAPLTKNQKDSLAVDLKTAETDFNTGYELFKKISEGNRPEQAQNLNSSDLDSLQGILTSQQEILAWFEKGSELIHGIEKTIAEANDLIVLCNQRLDIVKKMRSDLTARLDAQFIGKSLESILSDIDQKILDASKSIDQNDWVAAKRRLQKAKYKMVSLNTTRDELSGKSLEDIKHELQDLQSRILSLDNTIKDNSDQIRITAHQAIGGAKEAIVKGLAHLNVKTPDLFASLYQFHLANALFQRAEIKAKEDIRASIELTKTADSLNTSVTRTLEQVETILRSLKDNGGVKSNSKLEKAKATFELASSEVRLREKVILLRRAKSEAGEALSTAELLIKPKVSYNSSRSYGGRRSYGGSTSSVNHHHTTIVNTTPDYSQQSQSSLIDWGSGAAKQEDSSYSSPSSSYSSSDSGSSYSSSDYSSSYSSSDSSSSYSSSDF